MAQRLSAGSHQSIKPEPAKRATESTEPRTIVSGTKLALRSSRILNPLAMATGSVSVVRFTDLRSYARADPSAEALVYFHTVREADDVPPPFLGKAWSDRSWESLDRDSFFFQLLGLIVRGKCVDDGIETAVHHHVELVQGQPNAVIANSILFEVVRANLF